jgi:hypothetical protein
VISANAIVRPGGGFTVSIASRDRDHGSTKPERRRVACRS